MKNVSMNKMNMHQMNDPGMINQRLNFDKIKQ